MPRDREVDTLAFREALDQLRVTHPGMQDQAAGEGPFSLHCLLQLAERTDAVHLGQCCRSIFKFRAYDLDSKSAPESDQSRNLLRGLVYLVVFA